MSKDEEKEQAEFLFRYTSGRWLNRESDKVAEHYTKFNVDALKDVAACASGAQSVTSVTKLAEGGFNRVLLLGLDNGREVVARIPMARVDNTELVVTESDVATMEYVRTRLDLPVPRVLAWCADRRKTPVGAEYIIMEKAQGTELFRVWPRLDLKQKKAVVDQWIGIEKALLRSSANGYGSLFHKNVVLPNSSFVDLWTDGVKESDFVVGLHVGSAFWAKERKELDIDRGPWKNTLSYMTAAARREIAWISKFAKMDKKRSSFYPPAYQPSAHVALLERYLEVIPHLAPSDTDVTRTALVYDDSSQANIFISEDKLAEGKIEISAVIDWSCTAVRPLFMAARWPKFAKHPSPHTMPPHSGGESDGAGDVPPRNFDASLCKEELFDAQADLELRTLHDHYGKACAQRNPEYYRAMSFNNRELVEMMVDFSGRTWTDDLYAPLQTCLAYISQHWTRLVPQTPLPTSLQFTHQDFARIKDETHAWRTSARNMSFLRNALKIQDEDCWVHPDDFVRATALNSELKKGFVEMARSETQKESLEKAWPFEPEDGDGLEVDTARR
ncbi:hypothetical protein ACEPAH_1581 [Sanghuangporus vaninii]